MRRFLAVLCSIFPAYAEPPFAPIAHCGEKTCVMAKKDFEKLQQFHRAMFDAAVILQEHGREQESAIAGLRHELSRCQRKS